MRHRKSGRTFGMDGTARKAMFRNMVTSLMLHGRIRTTEARAKELRRYADKVITLGKNAPRQSDIESLSGADKQQAQANRVHAIRKAARWVHDDEAMGKVFGEYAERFANRPGGYTRVVKAGRREGDNAKMAVIMLTEAYDPEADTGPSGPEAGEATDEEIVRAEAGEVEASPEADAGPDELSADEAEAPTDEVEPAATDGEGDEVTETAEAEVAKPAADPEEEKVDKE